MLSLIQQAAPLVDHVAVDFGDRAVSFSIFDSSDDELEFFVRLPDLRRDLTAST